MVVKWLFISLVCKIKMSLCIILKNGNDQSASQSVRSHLHSAMSHVSQANQRRIMSESRLSVHVYCRPTMSNSSLIFKLRLKVLRSSADLQLYDSEFQTEGALTMNAFADSCNVIFATDSNKLSMTNDHIAQNRVKDTSILFMWYRK